MNEEKIKFFSKKSGRAILFSLKNCIVFPFSIAFGFVLGFVKDFIPIFIPIFTAQIFIDNIFLKQPLDFEKFNRTFHARFIYKLAQPFSDNVNYLLIFTIIAFIVVGFLYILFNLSESTWTHWLSERINNRVRCIIFRDVLKKDIGSSREICSSDLIYKNYIDANSIGFFYKQIILGPWKAIVGGFFIFYSMFGLNADLANAVVLIIPIYILGFFVFGKKIRDINNNLRVQESSFIEKISDFHNSLSSVVFVGKKEKSINGFEQSSKKVYWCRVKNNFIFDLYINVVAFIFIFGEFFILLYAVNKVWSGEMSVGQCSAFLLYYKGTSGPSRIFASVWYNFQKILVGSNRVLNILEKKSILSDNIISESINEDIEKIDVCNADYSIEDKKILDDVSVSFKRGEPTLIIGPIGSGKTSLLNCIVRLFDLTEKGVVRFNGKDIRQLNIDSMRNKLSYLWQSKKLFSATILENIVLGTNITAKRFEDLTQEEREKVQDISHMVGLDNLIKKMSKGYDTYLDHNQGNLSEGEKSLVFLAQSLMKDYDVLILDEPLNDIHPQLSKSIIEKIIERCKDKIIIAITHRTHYLDRFDHICFMLDGKLSDGTHESLKKESSNYSRFIYKEK